ncbi:hypothetical protein [Microcella flavibacter]|uniref:hypothetical protein n=1 Tax=Microcella flavibacter TaxID=1804990 RepID=UPI0014565A6B|nr:hypothetical protein [Microcella flavibacter]
MDAQRTPPRAALIALAAAVPLGLLAIAGALVLAVLVPGATDPAAWGTPPAIVWAAAMLVGFLALSAAALLAGRLLAGAAGRPHESPDAIVLAAVTVIGAGAIALWSFGVGIGLGPAPQWLSSLSAGSLAVALLAGIVAAALISDRLRRGSPARG